MNSWKGRGTFFAGATALAALTMPLTAFSFVAEPLAVPQGKLPSAAPSAGEPVGALANPSRVGRWSRPFDMGGVAIHTTLTRTGEVLVFQYAEGDATHDHTSWSGTWDFKTRELRNVSFRYHRDIFCAGQNILPGGRVFIAGGHDHSTGKKQDGVGAAETDTYNPLTRAWQPGPVLTQKRWYPTNVGLPNGDVLIFGGQESIGVSADTVDRYHLATNRITREPASATSHIGSYPRMHLVANGRIFKAGPQRMSWYYDSSTSSWSRVARMAAARSRGTTVLLPGGRKVLAVGGQATGAEPPTVSAEILDTSAVNPQWRSTGSLNHPRLHANGVILPNGKVLIVGGGQAHRYVGPVKIPELYDPATGEWTDMAPQRASRIYHSTALLLPDGRVLSAGQDDGPLAAFGEIFSPPYLFRGPRPTIARAPKRVSLGQRFEIRSPNARSINRITLVRAGSVTHSVDTDQRALVLSHRVRQGVISAKTPLRATVALPGYYMLFIINGKGVPSMARWVHVG